MPVKVDRDGRVYIHEINKLRDARVAGLLKAVEEECIPLYREHGLELFAYFESGPGQGESPETVEIWELPTAQHYNRFVAAFHANHGDARLRQWRERRSQWVASTDSMLCYAHPKSPTLAQLKAAGVRAKAAIHEMVHCMPSRQLEYLEAVHNLWWKPVAEPFGRSLLGLFYAPWNNRRAINIWGCGDSWDDIAIAGVGQHYDVDAIARRTWMTMALSLRDDWNDRVLATARFAPFY